MRRTILRFALAVFLLILLAGAGTFYWLLLRPLAVISGAVRLPGAPTATASRDQLGVPHVEAASIDDALWVQGYVTAQDRLWQMDLLRRIPAGELAEILGFNLLETDRRHRTLGLGRFARESAQRLPAADLAHLAAYARGVNAFIASQAGDLPFEFQALRYQPRPWEPADTLLISLHMFRILSETWRDELAAANGPAPSAAPERLRGLLPSLDSDAAFGSNAWAVSGVHTASGKPLLANDPHLDYSIPCIWYTAHLQAPGLNVIGVTLPGVPGVIIGHNDRIAWGMTNLHFDVQDLYLSDRAESTSPEIIHVRGRPDDHWTVSRTRTGPVVGAVGGRLASLRWTALDPSLEPFPALVLDLDRARNWEEFRTAASRVAGPAQNFLYADVDGNIGYQATGKLPIRRGFDGNLPVAAEPRLEWQGYIPFEALPRSYNPTSGRLVSANQNPFPPDFPYPVNGDFAPVSRSRRIEQLLTEKDHFEPADFVRIQTDVDSLFGHFFARALVQALDRQTSLEPELARARDDLRGWDGQFRAEEVTPVLATVAYNYVRRFLQEAPAAPRNPNRVDSGFVEQVLTTRAPEWRFDFDELLVRCLRLALREIRQRPEATATWGRYNQVTFAHPVGHRLPVLRRFFDLGPFPQAGTRTTVRQTTPQMGPSMRLVVDLADFNRSLHNLTTGESGQPFSSHYEDQWPAYYEGRSFPLPYSPAGGGARLTFGPAGR